MDKHFIIIISFTQVSSATKNASISSGPDYSRIPGITTLSAFVREMYYVAKPFWKKEKEKVS